MLCNLDIQSQYDVIHSYFKTTAELYDEINWNGKVCEIIFNNVAIERYAINDLERMFEEK